MARNAARYRWAWLEVRRQGRGYRRVEVHLDYPVPHGSFSEGDTPEPSANDPVDMHTPSLSPLAGSVLTSRIPRRDERRVVGLTFLKVFSGSGDTIYSGQWRGGYQGHHQSLPERGRCDGSGDYLVYRQYC